MSSKYEVFAICDGQAFGGLLRIWINGVKHLYYSGIKKNRQDVIDTLDNMARMDS